jgi:hypothetical protein
MSDRQVNFVLNYFCGLMLYYFCAKGGWIIMKCLLCIVAEDSGQPSPLAPTEESSASSTQLQNRTTEEKPKNQPRTNRKV